MVILQVAGSASAIDSSRIETMESDTIRFLTLLQENDGA